MTTLAWQSGSCDLPSTLKNHIRLYLDRRHIIRSLNTTYNHRATWQLFHVVSNKNTAVVRQALQAGGATQLI